jgi:hypothetical protein
MKCVFGGSAERGFFAAQKGHRECPDLENSGLDGVTDADLKILSSHVKTARHFEFGISNDLSSQVRWASTRQLLQQRLRFFQIARVEPLRKRPVDWSQ